MNILRELQGVKGEVEWRERRGLVSNVIVEPEAGVFVRVSLGQAGVVVSGGGKEVGIPLEELVKLLGELPKPDAKLAKALSEVKKQAACFLAWLGLAALLSGTPAVGQVAYPRTGTMLASGTALTNEVAVVLNSTNTVNLYRDRGLSMVVSVGTTNASSSPVTVWLDVSADGTNWTTTGPVVWSFTLSGTNAIAWTNFPKAALDNMRRVRVATLSNGHSGFVWVTNLWWSIIP
jgi:hypothetical protein